jgi:hypothetical protein
MIWHSTMATYQNLNYSNTFVVDMTNLVIKININLFFWRNKQETNYELCCYNNMNQQLKIFKL